MGRTTFAGPVRSMRGFISAGPDAVIDITADITLTFAAHAGKLMTINDADCSIVLPSILFGSKAATAGDDDPSVASHLGAVYSFIVMTAATDLDIDTDGTDKYYGSVTIGINDSTMKVFVPASTNDSMNLDGTTDGGIVGSYLQFTAFAEAKYLVQGELIGSGSIATPFADT